MINDDDDEDVTNFVEKDVGKQYYILNISDQVDLNNGFRYIKELLLQHHNLRMYNDYNKLKNAGINLYSVKSDAFTIKKNKLELAKELINFSTDIGGWRLSKTHNIIIPPQPFTIKQNNNITIEIPHYERININNEWDTADICNNIIKYKTVMIRAKNAWFW